jgi:stress-induced morphogen
MTIEEMRSRLEQAYPDSEIDVMDLTGTQDHYQVYVCAEKFKTLSRIGRHQDVMSVFSDELKTGEVHALTISAETP